jgi:integrase
MGRRTNMALSANKLASLPTGKHHDDLGLYLHVKDGAKGATRSWLLKFMIHGKAHDMGLGQARVKGDPDTRKVTLAEARVLRDEARALLKQGINPIEARKAQLVSQAQTAKQDALSAVTFEQVAKEFLSAKGDELGENAKHRLQWRTSLAQYVYPILGNVPVRDIDTNAVLGAMKYKDFWTAKTTTAYRVLGRIERVLAYAAIHGYRTGDNPARWKGHLDAALPKPTKIKKKKPQPSLHYSELSGFMRVLRANEGVGQRALEWIILNAVRVGDVTGDSTSKDKPPMLWSHIDMKAKTWTIPATKTGTELVVPLSRPALVLLERMKAQQVDERVFPVSDSLVRKVLRQLGSYKDKKTGKAITIHGFRSTFRTWASDCTAFAPELSQVALAHAVGNAVDKAYQRGDLLERRRELMEAWASFATGTQERAKVVALRKGR